MYNKEKCIILLRGTYEKLNRERYPRRADFNESEVVAIKAYLGAWPRALEAAGIKPPRDDNTAQKRIEKRKNAKRKMRKILEKPLQNRR